MKSSFKVFLSIVFLMFCGYIFLYPNITKANNASAINAISTPLNAKKATQLLDNQALAFRYPNAGSVVVMDKIIQTEEIEEDEVFAGKKAIVANKHFFYSFYACPLQPKIQGESLSSAFHFFPTYTLLERYIFFQSFRV